MALKPTCGRVVQVQLCVAKAKEIVTAIHIASETSNVELTIVLALDHQHQQLTVVTYQNQHQLHLFLA